MKQNAAMTLCTYWCELPPQPAPLHVGSPLVYNGSRDMHVLHLKAVSSCRNAYHNGLRPSLSIPACELSAVCTTSPSQQHIAQHSFFPLLIHRSSTFAGSKWSPKQLTAVLLKLSSHCPAQAPQVLAPPQWSGCGSCSAEHCSVYPT